MSFRYFADEIACREQTERHSGAKRSSGCGEWLITAMALR